MKTYVVVAGVLRAGDEVLLVNQQAPWDPAPSYALPGGRVEPGELLTEALIREVREETGLEVIELGRLLYSLQRVNVQDDAQTLAYVFNLNEWRGLLQSADPDGFILSAQFYPQVEAIGLLERNLPWRHMREPMVAHLRGEVGVGMVWVYRAGPDGESELIKRLG